MHDDREKLQRLFEEEFRLTLEAAYRLAAQSLVTEIEARERRLETEGAP